MTNSQKQYTRYNLKSSEKTTPIVRGPNATMNVKIHASLEELSPNQPLKEQIATRTDSDDVRFDLGTIKSL